MHHPPSSSQNSPERFENKAYLRVQPAALAQYRLHQPKLTLDDIHFDVEPHPRRHQSSVARILRLGRLLVDQLCHSVHPGHGNNPRSHSLSFAADSSSLDTGFAVRLAVLVKRRRKKEKKVARLRDQTRTKCWCLESEASPTPLPDPSRLWPDSGWSPEQRVFAHSTRPCTTPRPEITRSRRIQGAD